MSSNGYITNLLKGNYQPDFLIAAGAGLIAGVNVVGAVGHASALATTGNYDCYGNAAAVPLYPYLAAASTLNLSSSSANDTAIAGSGARVVFVTGLDASYNPVSENVALNGVTPVNTVNAYLRVNNAYVVVSGAFGNTNAGNISLVANSNSANLGVIRTGFGRVANAVYTVPNGFVAVVASLEASVSGGAAFTAGVARADNSNTLVAQTGAMNVGNVFSITATSPFEEIIPGNVILPQHTDISLRIPVVGQAATTVDGVLHIVNIASSYLA
jgi:hypothetical protein